MGVVYYGNYAAYLEQGRTDWLRAQGFSYKWMEANGVQLPVIKLSIDYKRPAHYDEVIRITTKLRNIPTYKIEFDYEIHNQDNQLLVSAYTALVFVDMETKKLMKSPDYLNQKLSGG